MRIETLVPFASRPYVMVADDGYHYSVGRLDRAALL
jgi:hypothetical protein